MSSNLLVKNVPFPVKPFLNLLSVRVQMLLVSCQTKVFVFVASPSCRTVVAMTMCLCRLVIFRSGLHPPLMDLAETGSVLSVMKVDL